VRRVTVEQLAEDPVGCYVSGATYLHFCAAPTLWGIIMWGRPDEAQAKELGLALVKQLGPPAVPHASLFDVSRVEGIDPGAFAAGGRYLATNRGALGSYLTRLALIRPSGISGATVAGAFDVLPRPYPARVFADAREGYAWLVAEVGAADWPRDGAALVEQLHAEASRTPALLGSLRTVLEAKLDSAITDAAKRLGVSSRSLQRKLGELGTTFQDELSRVRAGVAKRMLIETDAPLTSVALDLGFASLQAFSAWFREEHGESPSAFRKRARGEAER
jgi:AraC-like DNA-binding protein